MALDPFPKERYTLAQLEGKKRLEFILDAADPQAFVQSLPAEDLFFTIQEIGHRDAGDLVALASPEQFRSFVDLDAWEGHELSLDRLAGWLRLARAGADEGFMPKLRALDIEVQELLIRGIVRIIDLEEEGEANEDFLGAVERTPEGRFLIVYPPEGPDYDLAKRLIDELFAEDPFIAGRFLYAIRWELKSELEETALRWRNGRLADLGFPSPEEAASLYARADLSAPLPPPAGVPDQTPGYFLASRGAGTLLGRAMDRLGPERRRSADLELVSVLNAALVADSIPPAELEAVREAMSAVHATLSLGLERLAGSDEARAAEILEKSALRRVFQIGFTLGLQLRWRADKLRRALPLEIERGSFLLEGESAARFAALLQRRPRYLGEGGKVRAFASLAEITQTAAALDEIEAIARAFEDADFVVETAREAVLAAWGEAGLARIRYSDLFATRLARERIALPPSWEALPADRLEDAARALFDESGKLREDARALAMQKAADGEHLGHFIEHALRRLEDELGSQVAAAGFGLDARFAAPLLVSAH